MQKNRMGIIKVVKEINPDGKETMVKPAKSTRLGLRTGRQQIGTVEVSEAPI